MIISDSENVTVRDNRILDGRWGMDIVFGSHHTLVGNEFRNNTSYGIYIAASSYHLVTRNLIDHSLVGVWLQNARYNTIAGNSFTLDDVAVLLCGGSALYNDISAILRFNEFLDAQARIRVCSRNPFPFPM